MSDEAGRFAGKSPSFTPQQSDAIHRRGVSIALSAGAGCGKTFVLTQRFLAGLQPAGTSAESPIDLHQLVAITFTDRAAREMRNRIRAACHHQLQTCTADHVDHWLEILRGLDGARISTIHSFCTSLLRSQAVEAGLDPQFTVLEPALADTLLRRVARDTLHRLLEQGDEDAVAFTVQFGLERVREHLRAFTLQRFQIDFAAFSEVTPELLATQWLQKWQTDYVPRLVDNFRKAPLVERLREALSGSPSKNPTMIERIGILSTLLHPETHWANVEQTLADIRDQCRVQGGGGKKDWVSDERQEEAKLVLEKMRKAVDKLREQLEFDPQHVAISAELACRAVRLTQLTAAEYAAAKRAQGVLDFDDLLLHARDLLRDHEAVRQRVAAGIRLLMVDEFQDTDPVQADVVRSLCGAALTAGKLFMVGDRKQSIYRFRRADPTVFTSMSAELPPHGRLPLNVNFRSQPAVLNFVNHLFSAALEEYEPLDPFQKVQHSPTPAVEFLFAWYDVVEARQEDEESGASEALSAEEDEETRANAPQLRRREADWIARRIYALLDDPTPRIRSHARDAQGNPILRRTEPGDIVILFRALSNVQDYEAALRRYGLEYYLVGGKAFFAQQEVFDLLNLCRYLDDPDDLIGLVGVLRSPFFNLSDDAIQALATSSGSGAKGAEEVAAASQQLAAEGAGQGPGHASPSRNKPSLHHALQQEPPAFLPDDQKSRIRFANEVLSELRNLKDRIPLADLLNQGVERTGYDASLLAEFLGERKLANLRKLIDMARQFDRGNVYTLKDFVTRLQTSVLEESSEEFATTQPESGDVIRLMSIHQSKGLEFPVVIVADIDRKGPPRGGSAILHPELGPLIKQPEQFGRQVDNLGLKMYKLDEDEADAAETIRLFYVACTRAADYLILSAGIEPEKPAQSPWRILLESRFDVSTGLLKMDPLLGTSEFGTGGRDTVPEVFIHREACQVPRFHLHHEKHIAVGEIPGRVLHAEPGEFPVTSRVYGPDRNDLAVLSVSRLEEIDATLRAPHQITPHPGQERGQERERGQDAESFMDPDQATALGTLVHAVLEVAHFDEPDGWEELLTRAVQRSPDAIPQRVVRQAEMMLTKFFSSPLAQELAGYKSTQREVEFFLPWPSNLKEDRPKEGKSEAAEAGARPVPRPDPMIAGVIDLLIQADQGWHVIDYKTGEFPLEVPVEQLLAPYEIQMGLYAYAVQQWFGVRPHEVSLVVFRPQVRRITLEWSDTRWAKVQQRVSAAFNSLQTTPQDNQSPHFEAR
ncbi:UvrD-helicase domain-containing protein [Schlesneria sp. DSM 10557]|uniref:UvrD-helicase domain-containing protein n=1 Tax=Schlesneria sp. DSM 10557 TaxID=3044399 RepID=UPI00359FE2FA